MDITCSGCGKRYRIPAEKLPPSGRAVINCPQCKKKIELPEQPGLMRGEFTVDTGSMPEYIEYFDEGSEVALVFCDEAGAAEQIQKKLKAMGFDIRFVKSARAIRERFRYFTYPVVLLYQKGPDLTENLQEMIREINSLPQEARRRVFAVHVSISGNRFDSLQAVSLGLDMTLSPLDLADLSNVLSQGIRAKESRYRQLEHVKSGLAHRVL